MKKKFIVFTLCFTLIFSSINYKKSYAFDGGVISAPMLATVLSLAAASGIVIQNNDMIYNLGRDFVEYINKHNSLTLETVKSAFLLGHTVVNSSINVDTSFLDIVKGYFDNTFKNTDSDIFALWGGVHFGKEIYYPYTGGSDIKLHFDNLHIEITNDVYQTAQLRKADLLVKYGEDLQYTFSSSISYYSKDLVGFSVTVVDPKKIYMYHDRSSGTDSTRNIPLNEGTGIVELPSYSLPYTGGYNWDYVGDKIENNSVSLPIPGNLGNLVGQTPEQFWGNDFPLVGGGSITVPGVDNPSIDIEYGVFAPSTDIPGVDNPSIDNTWSNVTDYIIGLVVPSDSFWTDTFGGLHNNFISSFPMVDMTGFNSLVVNGKPFPNIDINIMGVKGRVVNGDTVNSIVEWLRPIIAGFIFLCLMFLNYRKLYKLIRNSEPFEGIGKVENHAN